MIDNNNEKQNNNVKGLQMWGQRTEGFYSSVCALPGTRPFERQATLVL